MSSCPDPRTPGEHPDPHTSGTRLPTLRAVLIALLLAQAGCTAIEPPAGQASPCRASEAAMACQVERYHNVNAD